MNDMTPFDEILEADTLCLLEQDLGPARDVTIVNIDDGSEHHVRGVFEVPGQDVTPGNATAPTIMHAPFLHIPLVQVQTALGRDLSRRDKIVVRGKAYRPQQPVDDGAGLLKIKLLECSDGLVPGGLS